MLQIPQGETGERILKNNSRNSRLAALRARLAKARAAVMAYFAKKNVQISARRYGVDAMGAMAQGLFASLLIGTILNTAGTQLGLELLTQMGGYASAVAGPAMAVSIGFALNAPALVLFSLITVGQAANSLGGAASAVGTVIMWATEQQPFVMGIVVSVVIGVALTLPISSAAICAALSLTGLAGGAAVAGCCAQMVGFAVLSFKENRWGGLVSQGLGTSMLQMSNILKNPRIWLPAILASAVTGPLATCLFRLEMNGPAVSSGMGTCGLVEPIGVYSGWVADVAAGTKAAVTAFDWAGLLLICLVLPAVLCGLLGRLFRNKGWIRPGDLTLAE